MAGLLSTKFHNEIKMKSCYPYLIYCRCDNSIAQRRFSHSLLVFPTKQLLNYLQRVNFTTDFGDQVSFDESGDVLPIYDVMNWMWLSDGSTEVKIVGEVKELASEIDDLILKDDQIFWNFESKKVC